jgi:uncharacterized protein (TIGR02611 family)
MFEKIKQHFQALLGDAPGKRFQQQFWRNRQNRSHPFLKKVLFIGGGVIVIAAGILALPLPGPGTVIIIVGLGLLAQESLRLSKFLDWLEVKGRKIIDQSKNYWEKSSYAKKVVIIIFVTIITLAIIGAVIYWYVYHIKGHKV